MPTTHDPFAPHSRATVEKPASDAVQQPKVEAVPQGTSAEILAWAGDDKDKAQRALDAEEANDKPRKGLVSDLKELLSA